MRSNPGMRPLSLGVGKLQELIPHRAPLLLVDGLDAFGDDPPAARAHKTIAPDEAVFAGHFPGHPIWPGAYTIEGLAQTCALVGALHQARVFQLHPAAVSSDREVMLVGVDVKLSGAVTAGDRVDYEVLRTHAMDGMHRFAVTASIAGRLVARGTLVLAEVAR